MLEFEHSIQINDPEDGSIRPLTRDQLWEGLLMRARNPGRFNKALSCRLENECPDSFIRIVQAGDTEFRETVSLCQLETIQTVTCGENKPLHAESMTSIEEPEQGVLFVRFSYRRELENSSEGQLLGEHLKSAYYHADIDAIAIIRMLVEDELLMLKPS